MSDPGTGANIEKLSSKIEDAVLALKWMFVPFLVFFSVLNFATSRSIDKFAQIFADALPGKPLPLLTVALIHSSTFLTILTFVWPILGMLNLYHGKRVRNWVIGSTLILFLIGLQMVLTWIGCFAPMIDIPTGMSDAPSK